jgi:enoyl-CoA hydratase
MTAAAHLTRNPDSDPAVLWHTDGPVATITLHRPACHNAVDGAIARLPRIAGQARALDLILSGRAVAADAALVAAQALAQQIATFAQACLRADRALALAQWDLPFDAALRAEGAGGFAALQAEGLAGAARFVAGGGRHGQGTPA